MSPRASASHLSITTTFHSKPREWQPARNPTPRYRASFPQSTLKNPDIPPVPSLSFFEADTPIDDPVSLPNIITTLRGEALRSTSTAAALDLAVVYSPSIYSPDVFVAEGLGSAAISPSIYSPLQSAISPTSTSINSPTMLSSPSSLYSPVSPNRHSAASDASDLSSCPSLSSNSSSTSLSSTQSTYPARTSIVRPNSTSTISRPLSQKPQNIRISDLTLPGLPILSPLLTPSYMFPRTPPAVPTTVTQTLRYEDIADTAEEPKPKNQSIGWSDLASPIRLDFGLSAEERAQEMYAILNASPERSRESQNLDVLESMDTTGYERRSEIPSVRKSEFFPSVRKSEFLQTAPKRKSEALGMKTKAARRVRSMWSMRGRESAIVGI